jgi:thiol-disulfide isomerase/thioredoxin
MNRMIRTLAACLPLAAALSASADEIVREGVGERRAALDKMELADFDPSLWAHLTDWTNGGPITPETAAGKVVLVYTWASYLPTSLGPMPVVNRLSERYAADGLLIVGVHDAEGFDDAARVASQRRAAFPIARDKNNALRAALRVDQDPDFYLIDRAGRVRYADIETASVERGVAELIAESASDAATLLERMDADKARAAEEARRTARLRSQINLRDLPWVPFAQPGEEEYKNAAWLEQSEPENNRSRSRRGETEGPIKINLEPELDWRPSAPANTEGRATLIYLFHPDIVADAARGGFNSVEFFRQMDAIQDAHARDLIVIGAMITAEDDSRSRRRDENDEQAQSAEKAAEKFDTIIRDLPVNHIRVSDLGGRLVSSRLTANNGDTQRGSRGRGQEFIIPYHILVSSDGVVRWHGFIGASTARYSEWEAALDTVLRVDPGIAARRAAEEAYIKSKTD